MVIPDSASSLEVFGVSLRVIDALFNAAPECSPRSKYIKVLKCSVPGGSCTMSPLTSFLVLPSACSTEMALGRLQTGFRRTSRVANVPFMISLNFR